MRSKGFRMNRIKDMIPYQKQFVWENCKIVNLKEGKWNVE
jgi:hypothetical protein